MIYIYVIRICFVIKVVLHMTNHTNAIITNGIPTTIAIRVLQDLLIISACSYFNFYYHALGQQPAHRQHHNVLMRCIICRSHLAAHICKRTEHEYYYVNLARALELFFIQSCNKSMLNFKNVVQTSHIKR